MRILIVEDDSSVAQSLELMLKSERFNPYITDLGHEAIELAKIYDYDIILLDLNLPDMSGYDVLRSLRIGKVKTPVLILSGFAGIEDKVRALGVGADDYVTKPFHKDELIARIHAIVRRTMGHAEPTLNCGDLTVKPEAKQAEIAGKTVPLTARNTGCWNSWRCARAIRSQKKCSLTSSTAAWTSRSRRSSTCSSASFAKSSPRPQAGRTISRPSGVGGTRSVSPSRRGSQGRQPAAGQPRAPALRAVALLSGVLQLGMVSLRFGHRTGDEANESVKAGLVHVGF